MNKKGNATIIMIGIIVAIILLGLATIIIFGLAKPGMIVSLRIPPTEFSGVWNGYTYLGETLYLGSIGGSGNVVDPITGISYDYSICAGEVSLTNEYSDVGDFYLMSGLYGDEYCRGNYIKATISLPAGTLKGRCEFYGKTIKKGTESRASCYIGDFEFGDGVTTVNSPKYSSGEFEIVLDEPTELDLRTITNIQRGKVEIKIFLTSFEPTLVDFPDPLDPTPGGFTRFINSIVDWFRNIFAKIFGTEQSIIGAKVIEPNTQHTYQFDLSTSIPDSNYADGTYQVQYANWALIDSDGNILKEGTWEKINGVYTKSVTITTPSNIGDFALLGMITQFDMTFNTVTGQWETSEEYIVSKEAIDLKTEYSIIEPEEPTPKGFVNFINAIIDWFRNLWSSIFG